MDESGLNSIPWLLIILRDPLTLAWLDDDIGPGFRLQNDLFEATGDSELSAFYDRLYDASGMFVGFQITPVPEAEIASAAEGLPFARAVNGNSHLRLFLVGVPLENPREVADQAFGGRIYRTFSGEHALSLDTFFLEDTERAIVGRTKAKWVNVLPLGSDE